MDTIFRGDLSTRRGRALAWIDSLFIDHALIRLAWTNFAPVVPGRLYRVTYTDDLSGGLWTPLDNDFVAGGPVASLSDAQATPQRFYRVQRLN